MASSNARADLANRLSEQGQIPSIGTAKNYLAELTRIGHRTNRQYGRTVWG